MRLRRARLLTVELIKQRTETHKGWCESLIRGAENPRMEGRRITTRRKGEKGTESDEVI